MPQNEVRTGENFHPEGLTSIQERLVETLFTTKTLGKVTRRFLNLDGSFSFVTAEEQINIIAFAKDSEHEFALKVHDKEPNAPLSPFFINLRNLDENVLGQIGEVMCEMTPYFESHGHLPGPDVCVGIPKAGVPLARAYSKASKIPMIELFDKVEHEDGTREIVCKDVQGSGQIIRLIDDLVAHASTKNEAVEAAQAIGYKVDSICVLIDRQQGGLEELKKHVPDVRAAMTITQILDFALRRGFIQKEMYEKCLGYVRESK